MTGKHLDYNKHVCTEYGAYVQTLEEHSNNMHARTLGAICLGPSGNEEGGHYFLSLSTGARIHRYRWTDLPMPDDVVARVNGIAICQGMPCTLTFGDCFGIDILDGEDEFDDDHNSAYESDNESANESADDSQYDSDEYDEENDDYSSGGNDDNEAENDGSSTYQSSPHQEWRRNKQNKKMRHMRIMTHKEWRTMTHQE
jgi:hypothetical protein